MQIYICIKSGQDFRDYKQELNSEVKEWLKSISYKKYLEPYFISGCFYHQVKVEIFRWKNYVINFFNQNSNWIFIMFVYIYIFNVTKGLKHNTVLYNSSMIFYYKTKKNNF